MTSFKTYYKRGIAYATFKMMGLGKPNKQVVILYTTIILMAFALNSFL